MVMTTLPAQHKRNRTIAVLLALLSLAFFPGSDALAKTLSGAVPILTVVWARFFGSAVVMTLVLAPGGRQPWPESRAVLIEILRALVIIAAFGSFVASYATIGLAEAMTYYAIAPIVSVVWATLILREKLTRYRAIALVVGIFGVFVALKPGGLSPAPGAFFALGTGCLYGFYLFLNRVVAVRWNLNMSLFLQFWAGTLLLLPWVWFDLAAAYAAHWPKLIGIAVISVLCNLMLMHAFRRAEASFLAPFFYIEIPSGMLIAVFFLNETLSWNVLLGAGMIVLAGAVTAREPAPKPVQLAAGGFDLPGPNQS